MSEIKPFKETDTAILTKRLIARMESEGVRYAILRNYENYPNFDHDLDLILHSDDLTKWRKIAVKIAQEEAWDYLTECDHWSQSPYRHHNIEIFRFYRLQPLEYLQVDLFHGFGLWGLELFNETQLLNDRVYVPEKGFSRISPVSENIIRIFQIYSIRKQKINREKITRYTKRISEFYSQQQSIFMKGLTAKLGPWGKQCVIALIDDKQYKFVRYATLAKMWFLTKYFLLHPKRIYSELLLRANGLIKLKYRRQCGFVLILPLVDNSAILKFENVLSHLEKEKMLYKYCIKFAFQQKINRVERSIMERGGIVIKFVQNGELQNLRWDNEVFANAEKIKHRILMDLIDNHKIIYQKI